MNDPKYIEGHEQALERGREELLIVLNDGRIESVFWPEAGTAETVTILVYGDAFPTTEAEEMAFDSDGRSYSTYKLDRSPGDARAWMLQVESKPALA